VRAASYKKEVSGDSSSSVLPQAEDSPSKNKFSAMLHQKTVDSRKKMQSAVDLKVEIESYSSYNNAEDCINPDSCTPSELNALLESSRMEKAKTAHQLRVAESDELKLALAASRSIDVGLEQERAERDDALKYAMAESMSAAEGGQHKAEEEARAEEDELNLALAESMSLSNQQQRLRVMQEGDRDSRGEEDEDEDEEDEDEKQLKIALALSCANSGDEEDEDEEQLRIALALSASDFE
jgi:hypothetical protein